MEADLMNHGFRFQWFNFGDVLSHDVLSHEMVELVDS